MNVNVLVLDTEAYSNTGGQMSKATPRGAVAKFATRHKHTDKTHHTMEAISYGSVYVARVAMGGSDTHTHTHIAQTDTYNRPTLIITHSHCIAHGYDMSQGMAQQKAAVLSGYWPLTRYNPEPPPNEKIPFSSIPGRPLFRSSNTPIRKLATPCWHKAILKSPGNCSISRREMLTGNGPCIRVAPLCRKVRKFRQRSLESSLVHRATGGRRRRKMIDITTTYLGLPMKSPIVASASPLCESLENIRHLEDAGAGAVVLPSLFEEQLDLESQGVDSDLSRGSESFASRSTTCLTCTPITLEPMVISS